MLTDGVLIMQHTRSDKGVLLMNLSLRKLFSQPEKAENTSPHVLRENIKPMDGYGRESCNGS